MNNKLTRYDKDEWFNGSWLKNFFDLPAIGNSNILKTNIRKSNGNYIYEVDIPGYSKEDVSVHYEDEYLIVSVKTNDSNKEKEANGYIRQERYSGSCSRSFYIGEIDENKISAKYNNGILYITFPDEEISKASKIKNINIQ